MTGQPWLTVPVGRATVTRPTGQPEKGNRATVSRPTVQPERATGTGNRATVNRPTGQPGHGQPGNRATGPRSTGQPGNRNGHWATVNWSTGQPERATVPRSTGQLEHATGHGQPGSRSTGQPVNRATGTGNRGTVNRATGTGGPTCTHPTLREIPPFMSQPHTAVSPACVYCLQLQHM